VHLDTTKVHYSPTNAQVIVPKKNIKIYIEIAPTRFVAVTPSSGSSLSVLAKVKIIEAQQARCCNSYKNTRLKPLKTDATVRFNKMCKIKHLKPNCISIKISGNKV